MRTGASALILLAQPTHQLSVNDISFPNFPLWRISTAEGKCAAIDAATESLTSLVLNQFYLFIHNHSMYDYNRQNILGIAWYVDLINPILLGGLKELHLLRVMDAS